MSQSESLHTFAEDLSALRWLPYTAMFWNRDLRCIAVNKASAHNFTALDSSFVQGQLLEDLPMNRETISTWSKRIEQAFDTSEDLTYHSEITVNGGHESIETTFKRIPLHESGDSLVLSMCRECKTLSNEVFDRSWRAFFTRHRNDVFLLNREGVIENVNKAVQGKSREFWIGQRFIDILNHKDLEAFNSLLKKAIEENEPVSLELPVDDKWYAVSLTPFTDDKFRTGAVMAELEDVTHKHTNRVEEEAVLPLLNDALSDAEEAIALLHRDGRIIYRNQAARRILSEKVLQLQDLQRKFQNKLQSPETQAPLSIQELNVFQPVEYYSKQRIGLELNGVVHTYESSVQPLHKDDGDTGYVLWTLRDVSRDERMIQNLLEEKEEMNHILRATSHDLRSSVSNIANLSRLLRQDASEVQVKQVSEKLISTADTLQHLLGSMIELARMDADQMEEQATIDLEGMMEQVREMLPSELMTRRVSLTHSFSENNFVFNQHYLRSILFNLVVNAIKYGDPKKEKIEVVVRSKPATNGLWLEVSDNGIGMNLHEIKEDLFKPFTRFTGESKGSGIGLSLVKHFTEKNGGEVHVESEPGRGTIFKLLLRSYQQSSGQYELF